MNKTIAVFGMGRVGLPLALAFADRGCRVVGVDVDDQRLATLNQRRMPFMEEGAQPLLEKHIGRALTVTTNARSAVATADILILTLGTPVDDHVNPVLGQLETAISEIVPYLREGQLIVLRSTVFPGTTEYLARYLEKNSSLRIGGSIYLACCPERIAEGKSVEELAAIPQIVGTLDPKSAELASEVFRLLTSRILVSDARSAELAKLFCNMYRYIDFAVANEFMMIAQHHERDIYEILRLANTEYKRGGLKQPGFTAGPCMYKDGFFLTSSVPYVELISMAWKINETVPAFLIDRMREHVELEGAKVVLLGLSFKRNIDDPRDSLAYKAKKILQRLGAKVVVHDPYLAQSNLEDALADADAVLIAMNHDYYKTANLVRLLGKTKPSCVVADIWNMLGTGKVVFPRSLLAPTAAPVPATRRAGGNGRKAK